MLLGWTEVDKTQSRRQSGLVCSLLVVSLLLSAVVEGEECAHGFPSSDTVNMYGPTSRSDKLNSTSATTLYVFPSMNFSCDGTITDIRMRMDSIEGLQSSQQQIVWVYFLVFHDALTTPNRSVTQILLNRDNTEQQQFTDIWQTVNLSLPVTEGDFIGFAVPANNSVVFNRNINLSPTSERVEAHVHQLSETFSEFVVQLPEVASAADSSQFTTQMTAPPLIDVTFSPDSSTGLTPSPTSPSTPTHPQSTPTPDSPPSQPMFIVIAVVATTVLLLLVVVVVGLVVVIVTVVCRRQSKEPVYKDADTDRGVSVQMTDNSLKSATYYEPMSLDMDPSHLRHQPHPLHTSNNTSAIGDHISMQECPAYQPIEDTPTSGDYTYI